MNIITNLIDNAVRHSPVGSRVDLSTLADEHGIHVVLKDNGNGIPAHLRDKVLQRFVRLENSRTTPGHGLGLSLASAVAKLHEATLRFSDNEPGLRITVTLPGARPVGS